MAESILKEFFESLSGDEKLLIELYIKSSKLESLSEAFDKVVAGGANAN